MKRKIILQGNNCLTVSLPIDWARKNKLTKKSELEVLDRGASLILEPLQPKLEEVEILANGNLTSLRSQLVSFYLAGIDKITVRFPYGAHLPAIQVIKEVVSSHLHCMEIDERDEHKCVIKSFSETNPVVLEKAIRNCLNLMIKSGLECREAFRGKENMFLEQITENYNDVKRFCFYALRLLNKNAAVDFQQALAITRAVDKIKEITNHIRHLTKHFYQQKNGKLVVNTLDKMNELLSTAYSAYYDHKKVEDFFEKHHLFNQYLEQVNLEKGLKENLGTIVYLNKHLVMQALIIHFRTNNH